MSIGNNTVWCLWKVENGVPAKRVEVWPDDVRRALEFLSEEAAERFAAEKARKEHLPPRTYYVIKVPG